MTMTRALAAAALLFAMPGQAQQTQPNTLVLAPGLPQTLEIPDEERVEGGIWDSAQQVGQRCLRMDLARSSYVMTGTKLDPKAQRFIAIGIFRDDRCAGEEVIEVSATGRSKSLQFKSEGGTFYAKVKSNPGPVALGLKMIPQTEIFSIGRGADIGSATTPRLADAPAPIAPQPAPAELASPPATGATLSEQWGILPRLATGDGYMTDRYYTEYFWRNEGQEIGLRHFMDGKPFRTDVFLPGPEPRTLIWNYVSGPGVLSKKPLDTLKILGDGSIYYPRAKMVLVLEPNGRLVLYKGKLDKDGLVRPTRIEESKWPVTRAAYVVQAERLAAEARAAEVAKKSSGGGGLFGTLLGAAVGGVAAVAGGADAATAAGLMMQGAAVTSGNGQMAAAMAKGSAEVAASNAQMEAQLQGSINRGLAQGNAQYRAAQGGNAASASTNVASQAGSSHSARTGGEGGAAPAGSGTSYPAEAQYIETLYYVCTANAPPRDGGPRDDWYVSRLAPVRVSTRGGAQDLIVTPPWRDYIKAQVPSATVINCNGDTDRSKIEAYRARIVGSKWTSYDVDYTPHTP